MFIYFRVCRLTTAEDHWVDGGGLHRRRLVSRPDSSDVLPASDR